MYFAVFTCVSVRFGKLRNILMLTMIVATTLQLVYSCLKWWIKMFVSCAIFVCRLTTYLFHKSCVLNYTLDFSFYFLDLSSVLTRIAWSAYSCEDAQDLSQGSGEVPGVLQR